MKNSSQTMCLIAGVLMIGLNLMAAPYVVLPGNRTIQGNSIRARSNGDVILTTAKGDVTYTKGQYLRAVADEPPNWNQVNRAISTDPDSAIPELQKIIREYANLDWDLRAMAKLAEAQVAAGKAEDGVATYEDLFRKSEAASASEIRWDYYQALIGAKRYNKVEVALKKEMASKSRSDAAHAQILRGDVLLNQGDIQGAAMDYLKTVLLFQKESDVQAEALYKAGDALKRMKDPRADDQFRQVVQDYTDSPWAAKAREQF